MRILLIPMTALAVVAMPNVSLKAGAGLEGTVCASAAAPVCAGMERAMRPGRSSAA